MKSGIYKIINENSGIFYIGSSINIKERFNQHLRQLNSNNHFNDKLQKAWNKYETSSFKFEVIEYIDVYNLLIREQYYLDTLLFANEDNDKFSILGYNINRNSNNTLGFKFSEEAKERMSDTKSRKSRKVFIPSDEEIEVEIYHIDEDKIIKEKDMSNPFFGKKHTDESKEKMSQKKKGENNFFYKKGPMLGRKQTDQQKKKISISNSGRNNKKSKPILQIDLDGNIIKLWDSSGQASKILGISQGNINECCNNKRRTANGYRWKFFIEK
jgi:group I intron endonuclease